MDPGNWATDLAGGSRYNYSLLFVILISSIMAMFLQRLSLKLGIVTGHDLAQNCRHHYGKAAAIPLWIAAEVAIAACDLAEVIGSAVAINLLFISPCSAASSSPPSTSCCCCSSSRRDSATWRRSSSS